MKETCHTHPAMKTKKHYGLKRSQGKMHFCFWWNLLCSLFRRMQHTSLLRVEITGSNCTILQKRKPIFTTAGVHNIFSVILMNKLKCRRKWHLSTTTATKNNNKVKASYLIIDLRNTTFYMKTCIQEPQRTLGSHKQPPIAVLTFSSSF